MPDAIVAALLAFEHRLTSIETRLEAVCKHINLTDKEHD